MNTITVELLEKKEELETLYNQLLMQHHSLPSEIHKVVNQQAMDAIDVYLTKLEKELVIEIEIPNFEEVTPEVVETVNNSAQTIHYLQRLSGIGNAVGTKIESVELDSSNKYQVKIHSKVNTDLFEEYSTNKVWTETTYNIKTGKMKTKAVDFNHRKDIAPAKEQIEMLIAHIIESNQAYKDDEYEARDMTTMYYYHLLKSNGYGSDITNEMDVLVNNKMKSVAEVTEWVNSLLVKQVA